MSCLFFRDGNDKSTRDENNGTCWHICPSESNQISTSIARALKTVSTLKKSDTIQSWCALVTLTLSHKSACDCHSDSWRSQTWCGTRLIKKMFGAHALACSACSASILGVIQHPLSVVCCAAISRSASHKDDSCQQDSCDEHNANDEACRIRG